MKLTLIRIALRKTYTIGKLYVDGEYFCDTLEDRVRPNGERKVAHETAIPYGAYEVTMHIRSPKYSNFTRYPYAKKYDGYMPRLLSVPNFEGILIHPGTTDKDSSGCILVGRNTIVGKLTQSQAIWDKLMEECLMPASRRGERITINITK